MVSFRIGKTVLVGTIVSERGKNSTVNVSGVLYNVATSDLHPFEPKRKGATQ